MRIHIQNPPGADPFAITPEQVAAACARAGESGHGHAVSYATDAAGFVAGMAEAALLIAPPGLLVGRFPVAAPKLSLIFCTAAGLDRLMPFDWLPPGVVLLNNRGVHGRKLGEFVLMALLMLANRMPTYAAQQRAQVWRQHHTGTLAGQRVTVIGTGDLGAAAARQARRFGMVATGVRRGAAPHADFDRTVAVAVLDAVLPESDYLVLACPLTAATRGLIDRRRLGLLPAGAGLVNVGRGALLDAAALCDALDAGRLSGAVCDVFDREPIPPGERLWTTPHLIVTPHVSADNPHSYNDDSLDVLFANLRAWRAGTALPNRVDLDHGY